MFKIALTILIISVLSSCASVGEVDVYENDTINNRGNIKNNNNKVM